MKKKNNKILIGDDSILTRKQLKDILSTLGYYDFIEAANGQEVIDVYKKHKPRLVFLDIVMPVKDGIEAIKEIIAFDPKADIVMVSTVGSQEQLRNAITEGAKDFVQKPIQISKISAIISSRFGGK